MKVIHWKTLTLLVVLILTGLWCVGLVRHLDVEAHDTQSILGSSPLYSLTGANGWINSKPLSPRDLKGKVVLVDFWDYSCINCIRAIPYIRAWEDKYRNSGLVVIGVHTPEFDVEKQMANVEKAVKRFGVTYPVALDSDYRIWNAFHNQYWPANYFIDSRGKVRYEHFGEGDYDRSERWIQELLKEASSTPLPASPVTANGQGAEAAADLNDVRSQETYIGYARADNFVSRGGIRRDTEFSYTEPTHLRLNEWGFSGQWLDQRQAAVLKAAGGKIIFRFHARDLHLVLGPSTLGRAIRFRVTVDGQAPGPNHGFDTDAQGNGVVTDDRLYQLIRQKGSVRDQTFVIEFLDPGVRAFSFTFG
ncbi:thioredoxin family protein [Occallatibacter riparius]|uniref:Thioredoxin family protein n=1 Tax=Occallatibacter riparius TaxID=1002689 RepID=A0A9J7BQW8_9BACT|nr:thioredoxin family protein [Occallatibacter riparius]UWZ85219.1 thioredoxin family protein [Occallatibacter riparius]